MFTFKIFEIADGKSTRTLLLTPQSMDMGEVLLRSGSIDLEFEKAQHFIRARLHIVASVRLICDRSLEEFEYPVNQHYNILFKFDPIEESEDEKGSIRNINQSKKEISIEQDVLDTILLNLPAKKLHPRFLDQHGNPSEFETEIFGASDTDEEETMDPRWEALKDLKN
jgi:uncharacterized metal-binding protein YceD (DUF177 family)